MNENDTIQNIMRSFDETTDGSPFSLSETRRLVNLSFSLLTAITLVLSIGLAISISNTWQLKKEMAVIREAVFDIDPFVIMDAQIELEKNPDLIDWSY
jgi:hypothetical protein